MRIDYEENMEQIAGTENEGQLAPPNWAQRALFRVYIRYLSNYAWIELT